MIIWHFRRNRYHRKEKLTNPRISVANEGDFLKTMKSGGIKPFKVFSTEKKPLLETSLPTSEKFLCKLQVYEGHFSKTMKSGGIQPFKVFSTEK